MQEIRKLIKTDKTIFKYAKGRSEQSGREFHNYYEILYFIGGKATFISENIFKELKKGDLVIIPKEAYHRFLFSGDETDYERCVFNFFETESNGELIDNSIKNVMVLETNEELDFLFNKAMAITQSNLSEITNSGLIDSILKLVLYEIAECNIFNHSKRNLNYITAKSIEYINSHLCDTITVEDIAKTVGISISALAHVFKKDMDIPIYKFILEKKLLLANKKILSGFPATVAANECGFKDYSGFYRQYKKMYGHAPSEKKWI